MFIQIMPPVKNNEALLQGFTNTDIFMYLSLATITTVILFSAIKLIRNNKSQIGFLQGKLVKKLS